MGVTIGTDEDGLPLLAFPVPFNASELFSHRRLGGDQGRRPAILARDRVVTYDQLAGQVTRFGEALLELGLSPGDRVVMVLPDCPEFVFLFLGAIRAGILPVPVSTLLRADDYAHIIGDSQCAAIVYAPEFADAVSAAIGQSSWRPRAVGIAELADTAQSRPGRLAPYPSRAENDCFLLYSSGTTGKPKGVVLAHRCLPVISHLFSEHMIGKGADNVIYSLPRLFTSFGLGIAMAIPLWLGAAVVLDPGRPTPEAVAALFRRFRPTIFAAVPTFYSQLVASGELHREDTASLRFCLSGGEAMPVELMRRWIALTGVTVREIIGSTEAGFVYIGNRQDDIRPGTTGKPIPGFQIRILDGELQPQPVGVPGRLFVKGQSVMTRYWNNLAKTAETLVDGWLDSGDVYARDAEGYYTYCGRGDDMLKVGGRWVSPFEIESALVEHPKVLEAAVVGRPGPDGLMGAEAWVVLRDASDACEATAAEIREYCKNRLAPFKRPRVVWIIDELPKTATGKVQRFKLRNLQ